MEERTIRLHNEREEPMNTKKQIRRYIATHKDTILYVFVVGSLGVLFVWLGCLVHGQDPSLMRLFAAALLYMLGSTLLMTLVVVFVLFLSDKQK